MAGLYEQRGGEVLANTTAAGHQDGAEIAYLMDGRFVLIWRDASATGGDTSGRSIRGQMFKADGTKSGTEFLVNTQTAGDQNEPGVTALAGGGFAVVWTDANAAGDGSGASVKTQVYDAAGTKLGIETRVNTNTQGQQQNPSISALGDGGFVVTFSDGVIDPSSYGVAAQLFNADGSKRGSCLLVNETTADAQWFPVVTTLSDGRFVVAWQGGGDSSDGSDIWARIYNSDGSASTGEFLVNTRHPSPDPDRASLFNDQERAHIAALAGGGFVISWQDPHESFETGGPGIRAQVFGSEGARIGTEIRVNEQAQHGQSGAFVAGLADGGFALIWTGLGSGDASGLSVRAALFDAFGGRNGGEFLVNDVTANDQHATFVARSPDGFTVAWADLSGASGDASGSGVKVQRFIISPATSGDDVLGGTEEADTIHGLAGSDTLNGLGGDDHLLGGDGVDTLHGGQGADRLEGGAQGDLLNGEVGADWLYGDTGDDVLNGGSGADELWGGLGADELNGGDNDDLLRGEAGNDVLNGDAGNDQLIDVADAAPGTGVARGGDGTDTLTLDFSTIASRVQLESPLGGRLAEGQTGAYVSAAGHRFEFSGIERLNVTGSSVADELLGGAGDDIFAGGLGADRLDGAEGADLLDGGVGADTLIGGVGDDTFLVDDVGDRVIEAGEEGSDTIRTSVAYTISANVETLVGLGSVGLALAGNGGANRIFGSDGDDLIDGGGGADRMLGGSGNDVYIVDDSGDFVEEPDPWMSAASGVDEIRTALPVYTMAQLVGPGGVYSYVENLTGLATTGQSLTGNDLANVVTGNVGNDVLDGQRGADTLTGGAGDDTYVVEDAGDKVIEIAGGGTDEVRVNLATYTLGANVENGTIIYSTSATLTGNALNNILRGGVGWDTLDGGGGLDTLIGGAGNDTYRIDSVHEVIVEALDASGGFDSVEVPFSNYTLPAGVELARGTSTKQTLIGNSGDNWFDGLGGGDTLIGGKGNDLYYDYGGETIVELDGEGVDLVRTTLATYTLGANLEELQGTSFSIGQTLIGNALNNRIIGTILNNRTDVIDGGLGADLMIGYHGNDIYYVDDAGDVIVEEAHHGTADEVRTTLAAYTLATNIESLVGTLSTGQALTGNALVNRISGGSGNDLLDGGAGADTLVGGLGNDVYVVDNGADVVTELAGEGDADEVRTALSSYQLPDTVEKLTGTSATGQTLRGNAVSNVIVGGSGGDTLFLQQGGSDIVSGGTGNDGIYFGAALTAADEVDGGDGVLDQIGLQGNYAGLTLGAKSLVNVEQLVLLPGGDTRFGDVSGALYSYNLTTVDANVAAGRQLVLTANTLRAGENVTFNGSAELDGSFLTYGGFGSDVLTGGQKDDGFFFGTGRFGSGDKLDGQGGSFDQLGLQGDYAGANSIVFGADQLKNIEFIVTLTGSDARFGSSGVSFSYDLTLHDGNVAAGQVLIVSANTLKTHEGFAFNGAAETDGRFQIFSGNGADAIVGGAGADEIVGLGGNDRITGGLGTDKLTGGDGADIFAYAGAADSTGLGFDTLIGFDYRADRIDLPGEVRGSIGIIDTGRLGSDTFNADLAAAVEGALQANSAILFRPTAGSFAGREFLVVDADGDGVYQAGQDFVFEVAAPVVPIEPSSDFFV